MYGVPLDYDPSYLDGVGLRQISVGEFQVILHFEGATLSIEGEMEIVRPDGVARRFTSPYDAAPDLLHLLKHGIADAHVAGPTVPRLPTCIMIQPTRATRARAANSRAITAPF